jgi:hypothetical protein
MTSGLHIPLTAGPGASPPDQAVRARTHGYAPGAREHGEAFRARAAEAAHAEAARQRAAQTVAGRALDASDCSLLLSILGLDAAERPEHT